MAIAMSDRLSSSCGFSRILYQKAWEIAQLSFEVNHPNALLRTGRADAMIML
ncbi:hypothetical protein [Nostoc sp.]